MEIANIYNYTIAATGCLALLFLMQLIVVDIISIRTKHVPGALVPTDHSNSLFRASRVVANSNESVAIFVLLVIFCIFSSADPKATAYSAWSYVIARLFYAICYYVNQQTMRSIVFGLSLLALIAMLVVGSMGWL